MADTVYRFATSADEQITEHAEHMWEEWHAYLSNAYPEWVSANGGGVCCHTCSLVIVDTF